MQLKFPHVRLMLYQILMEEGVGCVQAVVQCSQQLGLIADNKLNGLRAPEGMSSCTSLFAAEQVLRECLVEHGYGPSNGDKALADQLWQSVKLSVEAHSKDASTDNTIASLDCNHIGPIVMDVLLQKLTPYI
jgi:hypothetical protein